MIKAICKHTGLRSLYQCAEAQLRPAAKIKSIFLKKESGEQMYTKPLIEQHFHGGFGVNFNTAGVDDILCLSKEVYKHGIGGIFPTLVTDTIENTKVAVAKIKEAAKRQTKDMAKIFGVHLEGIFLNPYKCGIHNPKHFMALTPENFKLIEDEFIKIVTLAPELDNGLIEYLGQKGIKVQAGHCVGSNLSGCTGVTHLFNAMKGISHRDNSTAMTALLDDNLYTEIIADGVHVSDDALKLAFKSKPDDKVLLVSDCLPCTNSELKKFIFADELIFFDGQKATSKSGTLAGSTTLLPDIIKRLKTKNLFKPQYIENPYNYHNIDLNGQIEWDEHFNIVDIKA